MRIVVYWEDKRAGGKVFGPDLLLKSCIADDRDELCFSPFWWKLIQPIPKNGKDNVLKALKVELHTEDPIFAVLDDDKAHELCGLPKRPNCYSKLRQALGEKAPGKYEPNFLEQNLEFLLSACCTALDGTLTRSKPDREERDEIFSKIAFHPSREKREQVRREVKSFDRLVRKISGVIAAKFDS